MARGKVGKGTVKKGPISTVAKDCIVPPPDQRGSWGSTFDGQDIAGGAKGTPGKVNEVTFADIRGGAPESKPSTGRIPNRSRQ